MRIPKVESFLGCISLVTAGTILSWISGIGAVVFLIVSTILFGIAVLDFPAIVNITLADSVTEKEMQNTVKYF